MAVKMERVNGNTAGVIPQFGLGVAYIHQTFRLSTLGGQKNAVSRSARPTIENEPRGISGFVHPVVVSPSAKLRLPGHPGILATLPDESRYERTEVKKLSEEKAVGQMPSRSDNFRIIAGAHSI